MTDSRVYYTCLTPQCPNYKAKIFYNQTPQHPTCKDCLTEHERLDDET